jgi:hypothetical protein
MSTTEQDVLLLRLLNQALALACGVAQDVDTRDVVLLPVSGEVHTFQQVKQAKQWLREYVQCGRYGRRCFHEGCACS